MLEGVFQEPHLDHNVSVHRTRRTTIGRMPEDERIAVARDEERVMQIP